MSERAAYDIVTDPRAWPMCPTCKTAWVLRRVLTLSGSLWVWQRDCTHHVDPILVERDADV